MTARQGVQFFADVDVALCVALERSAVDSGKNGWNNTSTQQKRSPKTVLTFLSGSSWVSTLSIFAVDLSCVS